MKTISILGSGWLGLALIKFFVSQDYYVRASTTSTTRLQGLSHLKVAPFIINIDLLPNNLDIFLQSNILIVNIPSKNIAGFRHLITEIENSAIEKVLFVSSTSVYKNDNKIVSETDTNALCASPLLTIENFFLENSKFKSTIVRFGGLIGYSRNPGMFFSKGKTVKNPDSYVNLIHRDDCIGIISQIIKQQVWGEVFNGCANSHPTKREFYTRAAKKIAVTVPDFEEPGIQSFKIISNQKVKQDLNYEFLYDDLIKMLTPMPLS